MVKVKFLQKHSHLFLFLFAFITFVLVATARVVAFAEESSWQTTSVSIQAQIETDGQMSVVDQRSLHLNGTNAVVNWEIAKTTDKSVIEVSGVRLISAQNEKVAVENVELGELTEEVKKSLDESTFKNDKELCFFNEKDSWFYAYLPNEQSGQEVLLEISYTIKNAFYVYDDVAEVYWDYLPQAKISQFEKLFSQNSTTQISCVVLIPSVSETEIWNKNTVWGWGHGFDGTVEFQDVGAFKFESKTKVLDRNSRAHLIFPRSCLVNFAKGSEMDVGGARKNNAISEEETWSDESKITEGNNALVSAILCLISVFLLILAMIGYFRLTKRYDKMLGGDVSVEDQLEFDTTALRFQKKYLLLAVFFLITSFICIFWLNKFISSASFLILSLVCVVFANWTPTIYSSFRDKI